MFEGIRSRIESKIAAAALETSPFPHLIIEEFFPDDVYAKIQEYNPFLRNSGKEWMDKKTSEQTSSRTPYYARKQINFHNNDLFEAPAEQQTFWKELQQVFMTDNWFVIAHAPRAGPAFPAAGCAGSYGEISVAPGLRM